MDESLTAAELTLLGLLTEKSRHGYELEAVIAERGMREWTEIGFSSIYYLLTRLRQRGLIIQADGSGTGGPKARKVYAATAEGRKACAVGAEEAIAHLHPVFPRVLVGLANQTVIDHDRLVAALEKRSKALAERIEHVRRAAEAERGSPDFTGAIFDYSLSQLAAEQEWLARYRASLSGSDESGSASAPYDVSAP